MGEVTQLIQRARAGDRTALDALFELLYPELRRIARSRLSRGARDTLMDTTVLLHECYLKFANAQRLGVADREHFMAYAATVMRSVIVDAARAGKSERRGGDAAHVPIDTEMEDALAQPSDDEILDVDRALADLAQLEPRLARVVEMRYFGGLSEEEIGHVLGVTSRTVRRDWEKARMLLAHALRG